MVTLALFALVMIAGPALVWYGIVPPSPSHPRPVREAAQLIRKAVVSKWAIAATVGGFLGMVFSLWQIAPPLGATWILVGVPVGGAYITKDDYKRQHRLAWALFMACAVWLGQLP